ncbi:hypothetical protein [Nodosilinea sp. FACHB-13]|uniref:hypothetical protein n=1 Tax=Cyanophyceae TaxID=3028117 RepID=UPI0016881AA7|nr:hypothetical protein [Nodosilinea sp. FACHB-13]MBD2107659.1 hypothetical protein [Nodosilinea sp. FACHB-13]
MQNAYEPKVRFEVVGTPFLEQFYAIAMSEGSPLPHPSQSDILTLRKNGTTTKPMAGGLA